MVVVDIGIGLEIQYELFELFNIIN